ncbi:phage tail protein [Pseudomonas sp. IAC-BECa141]|uniref:phage tail protein n=1 Tax=Pseudomonas sp. IAC-BECa141 TaxID=2793103 RepID=UPI001D062FF7|nr:phage tail protein [Pseudomonas sp. IAC-BECa141]
MPWYKTGTVSVVQNSNAVIGTGTAFIANARVGDAFRGPDGGWYEVTNIASDTALSIAPPYLGGTNAAGAYALAPMQGYVKDSADALRALVNQFGGVMAVLGQTPTQSGVRASLNLTNTDGLPEGMTNKYMSATGVRAITLTGLDLTTITSVVSTDSILSAVGKLQAQVNAGVSPGYIDGLNPIWNSATSITVDSGTAYIPGSTKALRVSAPLTLSGLSLTANTWYYLYLFETTGVATIELVTTAPSAPYFGTARTKTGDSSRRFIAAVRCGASGLRPFLLSGGALIYTEDASTTLALSGGTATSATSVSCSSFIPPTTQRCILTLYGPPSGGTLIVGYANTIEILSCPAGTRYQADTLCSVVQTVNYRHVTAVTGGSSIGVRGYGLER